MPSQFLSRINDKLNLAMFGVMDMVRLEYFCVGIPFVLLLCVLSVIIQRMSRAWFEKKRLDPEVVGGFFQVVGSIYAILIGLVVYDATSRYSDAHQNVVDESKALVSVFLLADQIKPNNVSMKIKSLAQSYVNEVVSNDWDHLENETVNIKARGLIKELNQRIIELSPKTKNEEIIIPILVQNAMDAWRYRMSRFDVSTHRLPGSEWILLVMGGIATMVITFFYYLECNKSQSMLTFIAAFIISFSLYAILLFSEPYRGDLRSLKTRLR